MSRTSRSFAKNDLTIYEMAASGSYRVNAEGRIETNRRWNGRRDVEVGWYVCDRDDSCGYYYVSHHMVRVKAHRLAYRLYHPDTPLRGLEINHLHPERGTKDNREDNLELCDRFRQSSHAFEVGLNKSFGERHRLAKLSDNSVREIRRLDALGVPRAKLARDHGVTPRAIHMACDRLTWKHVE